MVAYFLPARSFNVSKKVQVPLERVSRLVFLLLRLILIYLEGKVQRLPATVTHSEDLECEAHVVLPGHTEDVGQVEREVDDAPAGCGQVGSGEERTDQEALHDGHHSKHRQEDKHHAGITVGQQVS